MNIFLYLLTLKFYSIFSGYPNKIEGVEINL